MSLVLACVYLPEYVHNVLNEVARTHLTALTHLPSVFFPLRFSGVSLCIMHNHTVPAAEAHGKDRHWCPKQLYIPNGEGGLLHHHGFLFWE